MSNAKTAVITGVSSGIGLATATKLVQAGWKVIGTGRHPNRTQDAETAIKAAALDQSNATLLRADLAELSEVKHVAEQILQLTDQIDILINNAGGVCADHHLTSDGIESNLAGNHVGHFLLTQKLLPALMANSASKGMGNTRIINVSSVAHEHYPGFDWDDLTMSDHYNAGVAYCRAKYANMLFTTELSRRLDASGIIVHAMHPGVVESNFTSHLPNDMRERMTTIGATSPDIPAKTLIFLAESDLAAAPTGRYWFDCEQVPMSEAASNAGEAAKLWNISEQWVARYL